MTKVKNLFIFLLIAHSTFAQISGKVMDSGNQPIPFVNVVLYQTIDSSIVSSTSSNTTGVFTIPYQVNGNYFLGLSSIGFSPIYTSVIEIDGNTNTVDLGDIILHENTNDLDGVTVSVKKEMIQNNSTGQVINIQSSLLTSGSNAMQVLERLPGVLVDKRNNQFSLNGQSGVTILFNGRKTPLAMVDLIALLESTMADNIENIELITSPSSQYDADGGAGIINITFQKNKNLGNQLSLNSSIGYGVREKASTNLAYSLGKEKLSLNAAYSYNHNNTKNGFEGFGISNMPILGGPSIGTFATYYQNKLNANNLSLGLVFQPYKKAEIGTELMYSYAQNQNATNINNSRNIVNQPFLESNLISEGRSIKQNLISSLFLNSSPTDNSSLDIDFSFLQYSNNSPNTLQSFYSDKEGNSIRPTNEIFTDGNRGQSLSEIRVGVMKVDFEKSFEKMKASTGIKASYSENNNDSKIETNIDAKWIIDPRSQSLISGVENLWAAYSQLNFNLNKRASLDLGLRYEYWKRTISNNESPFIISQFFPSVIFQYDLSENSKLHLNANRRISRPAYEDLVAALQYNDPTAIFTGNPLLKPTLVNTAKIEYSINGFHLGLSAQKEVNPIIRYQLTGNITNDVLIISPQNAEFQNSLNLSLNLPIHWANWAKLSLSSNTSLRKYQINYAARDATKKYLFQSVNFAQSISLPSDIEVEMSGWRNFVSYTGTNKTKGFGLVNLGIAKKLKNEKGTFQFSISDVFKSMSIYTFIGEVTPLVFDIDTESRYRDESGFASIFRISYSRIFGKGNFKSSRKFDREEERQRIN